MEAPVSAVRKAQGVQCLYFDIFATQSQTAFMSQLSGALLEAFPQKKAIGKRVWEFITGLRPVIGYDNLTGKPEVSFQFERPKSLDQFLQSLFAFLEGLGATLVVAVDEFQQIAEYPEDNTEALLRTIIQPLRHVRFIFSGSSRHVLSQRFTSSTRPFYG
ncbi:MAG TPA: hypothetical protein PKD90_13080 [Phnomibacter sp.]|nr:hypothetical protein [Phnomibacter sp.]